MLYSIITPVVFLILCSVSLSLLLIFSEKYILNYGICNITINDGEKGIDVEGGGTLLSSLAENKIFIPSACGGRGSCAYCKVKVKDGGGRLSPIEEPNLDAEEISLGIRLSCQVKIREDIKIQIPDEFFQVKQYKAILFKKVMLTYDILSLEFNVIEPNSIIFKAGQYIQLQSKEYMGIDSVMRAYSISSMPSDNKKINLIVRKVPDGICTSWIFDNLKEDEEIYFLGPYGDFNLSKTESPIIFIAGGSGMAPIWSILQDMVEKGIKRKATYFFGALTTEDLFYQQRLEKLSKESDWFDFVPTLSNEPEESKWSGERGLVTDIVKQYIPDTSNYEAYLCGSPGMINACVSTLTETGMLEENIFYDKFA